MNENDSPQLYTTISSPVGELLLVGDERALRGLYLQHGPHPAAIEPGWRAASEPFADVCAQLDEYFAGQRHEFELELEPSGTTFQRRVWSALESIPYGTTETYGELARRLGVPRASRAVGRANGRNPISIVVPCHRVIGTGGNLTGYGGGIERKRTLLELEGSLLAA